MSRVGILFRAVSGSAWGPGGWPDIEMAKQYARLWSARSFIRGEVVELERCTWGDGPGYRSELLTDDEWRPWDTSDPEQRRPAIAFRNGEPIDWNRERGAA